MALAACTEITTPPERATAYHGQWTGANVTLTVTPTEVTFRRTGGVFESASSTGPFRGLSHGDIIYQPRRVERLKVSAPPRREGNVWKMTVEGTALRRR